MTMKPDRLSRLLRPTSIATFGGSWSASIIKQCQKMGFRGQIWPIHPEKSQIEGVRCYRNIDELPSAPDASFIGVNRDVTIDLVQQLATRGSGGAVCFASGFAEVADGQLRQQALLAAAGDMPILGPNCYGFINYLDGALLWPDQHGGKAQEKGVAIITQSSNIAINLTMQRRALPIAYMLTAGNQAQIGVAELAQAVLQDDRVSAIGLHIEGFDDIAAMENLFRAARERRVPIVALKVGRSEAARTMTLSHTASLAGSDKLVDAFFDRYGVARVEDLDEFIESLKLLHLIGISPDKTLASMSCSGGEASLVGDLSAHLDVDLRPLTEREITKIKVTLPPLVTISNPLDYHTFSWGNKPALTATFAAMLECCFGMTMIVVDFPRLDHCQDHGAEVVLEAAIAAVQKNGGRLALVSSLVENMTEDQAERLMQAGIVPLMGLRAALAAIAYAAKIGKKWGEPLPPPLNLSTLEQFPKRVKRFSDKNCGANKQLEQISDSMESHSALTNLSSLTLLDEVQSKAKLQQLGIAIPQGGVVHSADVAVALAKKIGFPVVIKAVGQDLAHKSELNAVKLNLNSETAVIAAVDELKKISDQFLVETMVVDGVAELLIGLARDEQFGLYLTLASGGVMVELWQDAKQLLLPTSAQEIRAALMSLKLSPLLQGFRGRPAANIEAIVDVASTIAHFALEAGDQLEELDINPLIVTAHSVIAADALIRQRRS